MALQSPRTRCQYQQLLSTDWRVQGMVYLHKSVFQSHGRLSSANCLVDGRWVLKVSGFALHTLQAQLGSDEVVRLYSCSAFVDYFKL